MGKQKQSLSPQILFVKEVDPRMHLASYILPVPISGPCPWYITAPILFLYLLWGGGCLIKVPNGSCHSSGFMTLPQVSRSLISEWRKDIAYPQCPYVQNVCTNAKALCNAQSVMAHTRAISIYSITVDGVQSLQKNLQI